MDCNAVKEKEMMKSSSISLRIALALGVAGVLMLTSAAAGPAQEVMHITGDKVGIGTNTPAEKLHVVDGNLMVEQTGAVGTTLELSSNGNSWEIRMNSNNGRMTFTSPGGGATTSPFKFDRQAGENLFRVGVTASDTVDINGKLVINGTDVTPDYVFDPAYPLESIEAHSALMWENHRLPALPGAKRDEEEGVDVLRHSMAVLEELEKAHIYIAQLNTAIKELQSEVARLKEQTSPAATELQTDGTDQ